MALTDTHIRNAKPRAKSYKLSDGGGMYLSSSPMARVTGGWTIVFQESAVRSPSAFIQQRHSLTRVPAVRKREHYWRKTPTQASRRKQPSEPQSTRTKPRSRSSRGNGSITSAKDLSPDTAHRSLLD